MAVIMDNLRVFVSIIFEALTDNLRGIDQF